MFKLILFIIAGQGYHPIEYGVTRKICEDAGIRVEVASNIPCEANATPSIAHAKVCNDPQCKKVVEEYPQYATAKVDIIIDQVNADKYDGIFIIGGPGAMEFLDNETVFSIMRNIAESGKPYGAICISPRILARAGILKDKHATGWNGDQKLDDIFEKYGVKYIKSPLVKDGTLITADGPFSSREFAQTIVDYFK